MVSTLRGILTIYNSCAELDPGTTKTVTFSDITPPKMHTMKIAVAYAIRAKSPDRIVVGGFHYRRMPKLILQICTNDQVRMAEKRSLGDPLDLYLYLFIVTC